MPKTPKNKNRTENSKIPKLCAYCKNHGLKLPEKDHKPCPHNNAEHFKKCHPCHQNYKKTENVRRWREKKNKTDRNRTNDILGTLIDNSFKESNLIECENILRVSSIQEENSVEQDGVIEEILELENDVIESQNYTFTTTDIVESSNKDLGLILAVIPQNYPFNSLTTQDTDSLQNHVEEQIDKITDESTCPRFSSSFNESGYWKVSCVDEFTRDWFLNVIENFYISMNESDVQLKVVSINDVKKFVVTTIIPADKNELNDPNKIEINRFHKQNPQFDVSRWNEVIVVPSSQGYQIKIQVDSMNLKQIMDYNSTFKFGENNFKFNVI